MKFPINKTLIWVVKITNSHDEGLHMDFSVT